MVRVSIGALVVAGLLPALARAACPGDEEPAIRGLAEALAQVDSFRSRFDNGGDWYTPWRRDNREIDEGEVRAAGGPSALAASYLDLGDGDRDFARDLLRGGALGALWQELDPEVFGLVSRFDVGEPTILPFWIRGRGDFSLTHVEVASAGVESFLEGMRRLSPAQRSSVSTALGPSLLESEVGTRLRAEFPELFDPRDVGRSLFTSAEERRMAEEVRAFLREVLRIEPTSIRTGISRRALDRFATFTVPASERDQFLLDVKASLEDGERMGIPELHAAMRALYPRTPRVPADALARAIDAEPDRFRGHRLIVTGYPKRVGARRHNRTRSDGKKVNRLEVEYEFFASADFTGPSFRVHYEDERLATPREPYIAAGRRYEGWGRVESSHQGIRLRSERIDPE